MECRKFGITLISANNLEDVFRFWKMKVHARVSITAGSGPEKRTRTDRHGETNPAWNFTMSYTIGEATVQNYNAILVIKLYCSRKLLADRYVGEVNISMKELFDCARATEGRSAVMTLPVQRGCVNSQGALRFSYRFGERVAIDRLLLAETVAGWSFC